MESLRRAALLITTILVVGCTASSPRPETLAAWQEQTRIELDAARDAIIAAHPGMIDTQNPGFRDWVDRGYAEARALVPHVARYDDMMSVVRWYTTGFYDGHLIYSDDTRSQQDAMVTLGWAVAEREGVFRVIAVHDEWPVTLPAVGSVFEGCDGRDAETLMREDIAPFVDRRPVEGRSLLPWSAQILQLPGREWRQCRFKSSDGEAQTLEIRYQPVPTKRIFAFFNQLPRPTARAAVNDHVLADDVLWIRAGNFQPRPDSAEVTELQALLDDLPRVIGARAIVFDVRGNGGGDSSIGDKIFDAATGGLDFDQSNLDVLPRYFAQWRVSDVMLETVRGWVTRNEVRDGIDAPSTREARAFLAKAEAARAAGADWVEQDAGRTLTRESVAARGGRLRRFEGPIYVLTDEECASACLDFVDLVRLVPGSVHLGRTTSSDRVYIDMGRTKLPSGNHLWLPLKVWRNRWRGDAEPWVPDVPLSVDFDDDAAVRVAVTGAIGLGKDE